jgi:hypothetical protein
LTADDARTSALWGAMGNSRDRHGQLAVYYRAINAMSL